MIIAVDFDGTIVEHCFPGIGAPVPGAIPALRHLSGRRDQIILWTMRSGKYLDDALRYLRRAEVQLDGINVSPGQRNWTTSPKAYADVYIDDSALGCPLVHPGGGNG